MFFLLPPISLRPRASSLTFSLFVLSIQAENKLILKEKKLPSAQNLLMYEGMFGMKEKRPF